MNYPHLTNPNQQPRTQPYVFSKRNERIDWRRIAAVDVDRVARDLDFQVLQDNIEHLTLCSIENEVDSRAMDPNFIKLYKMAQLTIEYLLLCQDQITSQLVDYEQLKSNGALTQDESRREIQNLKNELNTVKKESKRRKKLIESQQKMLMTQHPPHHRCPVCSHSFLTLDYLQAHLHRRHPEYDTHNRREHDVDIEKEIQRLKEELNNKQTELQVVKVQKAVDEEKIRERDDNIRQLKENIQSLTTKMTVLEEKYFTLRSSTQSHSPSPSRPESGVKELLKENKALRSDNEDLKNLLQQAEQNFKKEEKQKKRLEHEVQKLKRELESLNGDLRTLQGASGDTKQLSEELVQARKRYAEAKQRIKNLEQELDQANKEVAHLRRQPQANDRKSPVPPPRSSTSPPPPIPAPARPPVKPNETTEILLPQFCPGLVRKTNENPRYLNQFRNETKKQLFDELEQLEGKRITEKDTRLSTNDYQIKMQAVEYIRKNMQRDLPNFERIRSEVSRTVDRLAMERLNNQGSSVTSTRSSGGKLVKFEDESHEQRPTSPRRKPAVTVTTTSIHSKPKNDHFGSTGRFGSDNEKTYSEQSDDDYSQPTKSDLKPSPRKNLPSSGVSSLVSSSMRPAATHGTSTISAIVRPKSALKQSASESDDDDDDDDKYDNPVVTNITAAKRTTEERVIDVTSRGQKPNTNIASHQPIRTVISSQNQNDGESDESLTSIEDTIPPRRSSTTYVPQTIGRPLTNHQQHLSSGEGSQYTYDSLFKTPTALKGTDVRRPLTADSTKNSNTDSEDELDDNYN